MRGTGREKEGDSVLCCEFRVKWHEVCAHTAEEGLKDMVISSIPSTARKNSITVIYTINITITVT